MALVATPPTAERLRVSMLARGVMMALVASRGSASRAAVASANQAAVQGLEPQALWGHFAAISTIPRPSGHEAAVLNYIRSVAEAKELSWSQDAAGNLLVKAPGRGMGVTAPPVIVQNHVDMVTEKHTWVSHDFTRDPIALVLSADGQWLGADGTTLGADNGIGVAAALALLDEPDATPLPPLELLFTVDEETGLTGAKDLDPVALGISGKTMLNLDTEEWGNLYIGCAGGGDASMTIPIKRAAMEGDTTVVVIGASGLRGGHSGINIGEGRANAGACARWTPPSRPRAV